MSIDTPFVVKLGDEIYVELHAIVVVLEVSHVVFLLKCSSFLNVDSGIGLEFVFIFFVSPWSKNGRRFVVFMIDRPYLKKGTWLKNCAESFVLVSGRAKKATTDRYN